jgi:hypothetical protein
MAESPPCRIGAIDETTTLATCFLSSNARFLEEAFGAMSYPLGIGAANCSQGQPRCREASLNGCVMPSPCHSYIGKISFLRGQHALCLVLWVCARARSHYRTLVRGRREAASRCSFRRTANDCASGEVIPTCAMAESGRSGWTELACISCCPRASIRTRGNVVGDGARTVPITSSLSCERSLRYLGASREDQFASSLQSRSAACHDWSTFLLQPGIDCCRN